MLTKGQKYDLDSLTFVRWSNGESVYGGISFHEFFDNDGVYLGADADGVEPIFEQPIMGRLRYNIYNAGGEILNLDGPLGHQAAVELASEIEQEHNIEVIVKCIEE